jgi:protein-disulfide isomerase
LAIRSRVGLGAFAPLVLIAAVVVAAVGSGVGSRASNGNGAAASSNDGSIAVAYRLVHPAGTRVTAAELDATKAVLERRLASLGALSTQVKETIQETSTGNSLITDQIWVYADGFTDLAKFRRVIGPTGRLDFVLLPPDIYGTAGAAGPKPAPNPGDTIDPTLPAQVNGSEVAAAVDPAGSGWVVDFAFTDPSAKEFETWTGQHVNDFFAIVLDGKVLSAPYIESQITGGRGVISGDLTADNARELAALLKSGPLPFPLEEESVQFDPGSGMASIVGPQRTPSPLIATSGRTIGDPNAPVTVDVWLDYQCPSCASFYGTVLPQLISAEVSPGKARIAFHDLIVIDGNVGGTESLDTANATRCAADQGEFAMYQAWLMANPGQEASVAHAKSRLKAIAAAAGLGNSAFDTCVTNGTHNAEVLAESASAAASSLSGTPSVLVGGALTFSNSYDDIKAAIDATAARPGTSPAPTPIVVFVTPSSAESPGTASPST